MLGYAVIDTETTGLNIRGNDRIIEVAVVLLDMDFNITAFHETILNPERDLGLVSLHGIDGLIASEGTFFRNVMPSLSGLLHNRVIIGHNVQFDIRMLETEYEREGVNPEFGIYIDTLQIAKSLPFRPPNYKLETLCEHFDIPLKDAHNAMSDTIATAKLLVAMLQQYDPNVTCFPADFGSTSTTGEFREWKSRKAIRAVVSRPADLKEYIRGLDDSEKELPESSIDTYLKTIHLALINDTYSSREKAKMRKTISDLSLNKSQVIDLNEEYIFQLICRNLSENNGKWVQGHNSEHIQVVQKFTGIDDTRVEWLLQETLAQDHLIQPTARKLDSYFSFMPGDIFVITGEDLNLTKEYWEELLCGQGFISKSGTTLKTKLVIAADPYSLSAKAVKAHKYGIPVVTENTISRMMNL